MWFLIKTALESRQTGEQVYPTEYTRYRVGCQGHRKSSPNSQTNAQGPHDKVLPSQKGKAYPTWSGICGALGGVEMPYSSS